ncbi:MAG: hypothetical protein EXS13_01430 [Planctomycetes bacterium]|nr:hypothetical protein [Planctomycetota bacterium]
MAVSDRVPPAAFATGAVLVVEEVLETVALDVAIATLRLRTARHELCARGVVATNLLGPWDGAPGVVEWLRVVSIAAGETCVELRVRYATVPRHYRLVAREFELVERS